MRKIILFISCMIQGCLSVMAQGGNTTVLPGGTSPTGINIRLQNSPDSLKRWWFQSTFDNKYNRFLSATESFSYLERKVLPGTITSAPVAGDTYNDLAGFLALYSRSQPPVVTFTPGTTTLELTSASTGTANLNYTYSKQTGTNDFTSLQFTSSAGSSSTIGGTAGGGSGTYSASFPTNTTTTFTFRANTTDKFATATATINYSARRYFGRASSTAPTTTEILASNGGGSALSGSKAGTFVITASGTNYPFFAYPSSLGTLTSIKDANGLEAITSYNTGTVSLTNGQGFTQTYRYYIAQNATAGNTTMVTQ